jgi:hypothetical protein
MLQIGACAGDSRWERFGAGGRWPAGRRAHRAPAMRLAFWGPLRPLHVLALKAIAGRRIRPYHSGTATSAGGAGGRDATRAEWMPNDLRTGALP